MPTCAQQDSGVKRLDSGVERLTCLRAEQGWPSVASRRRAARATAVVVMVTVILVVVVMTVVVAVTVVAVAGAVEGRAAVARDRRCSAPPSPAMLTMALL